MRTLILLLAILIIPFLVSANVDSIQNANADFEDLIQQYHGTDSIATPDSVIVSDEITIESNAPDSTLNAESDTVQIRVGKHNIEIRTDEQKTIIDVEKIDEFESQWDDDDDDVIKPRKHRSFTLDNRNKQKFNGHWASFDFGGNQLLNTVYPDGAPQFLLTHPEKSFEVNINFAEYSFGFGSYVGIVTGLGLNFNDYKFKNPYTIQRDENGVIQPIKIEDEGLKLTKLSTGYITAPLMLEFQIPGNFGEDRLYIAAGLIGGLKIGEHTKTKIDDVKAKNKTDHAIAPRRWGYTARAGFNDFGIYATYYNTGLFEKGKGPKTTPFTVGVTLAF